MSRVTNKGYTHTHDDDSNFRSNRKWQENATHHEFYWHLGVTQSANRRNKTLEMDSLRDLHMD